ncbi:DUF6879 family protein [Amycolatopsis sp. NPDC059027]|uniref:DUF6879 family protein n=1 Tax=unclassified Amycolatopsis TaxID=2618356 RepID=UPI00366AD9C7
MPLTDDEVDALFDGYKHSAFRLETLQVYRTPGFEDSTRQFLSGEPMPEGFNADWHETVRGYVAAGKTMQRAKVVRRPLSDYTRCLLSWGVPGNIAAGEDYHILDLTDRAFDLPDHDFWLFDDETVLLLDFNADSTLKDWELADPRDLDRYRRWRDLALAEAVPWSEYRLP